MRLSDLAKVVEAVSARDRLTLHRDIGVISVAIDGKLQDEALCAEARPGVVAELERRIFAIEAELGALGVEVA